VHLQEDQKHVALFIHGYNNSWQWAVETYQKLVQNIFAGQDGLGICILFSWPSDGAYLGYLPDRLQANESAADLSQVLNEFYDWLLVKQNDALRNSALACKAKMSLLPTVWVGTRFRKQCTIRGLGNCSRYTPAAIPFWAYRPD